MPILYGFYSKSEKRSAEIEAKAKAAFDGLSANHKAFFHNTLPPIMMATGIGVITDLTLPVLVRRWMILSPTDGCDAARASHRHDPWETLEEFMKPFIGVVSNVGLETDAEFNKRVRWHGPKFGTAEIKKVNRGS